MHRLPSKMKSLPEDQGGSLIPIHETKAISRQIEASS